MVNLPRQSSLKLARAGVLLAGILLGQVVLYGPSLVGRKILLPLDYLTGAPVYIPRTPETQKVEIQNEHASDEVLAYEPTRRFARSELRAGRWPTWAPYQFAGTPFLWPMFSPFYLLQSSTDSPAVIAWSQVLAALVAGAGAYCFCRRVLGVGFWPAATVAWCYPLTGFFVLWQGCPAGLPACWLPWLLLAVARTVRRAGRSRFEAPVGLAVATALVLASGQLDVAGQVLLVSGLFGVWCLLAAYGTGWLRARRAVVALTAGWLLGFVLAAPAVLPALEYTRTGDRVARRSAGAEERPPAGLKALPQTVLPDMYGALSGGNVRLDDGNQSESSAAAYAGVLATLLVAPLAWSRRKYRSANLFWALLLLFSLSWCLGLPGFVQVLRLPGLNMMSHNRLVFGASFAILALAATGLEALRRGEFAWRQWFWVPLGLLGALCLWCGYRATVLPEVLETVVPAAVESGRQFFWIRDMEGMRRAQAAFS